MDDDNLMDVNFTDLDVNQEPRDPPFGLVARVGPLLHELETAHGSSEERIQQLQGFVAARARQRQSRRQKQNSMETSHICSEMNVDVDAERGILDGITNMGLVDMTTEKEKGSKKDSSHLVAKALETDSDVKKADKGGGRFYDCNTCLDLAKDPFLTSCGHLFCWACFYQVSDVDSSFKDCPVCKGEVSDGTLIPVYGNGSVVERIRQLQGVVARARQRQRCHQEQNSMGITHIACEIMVDMDAKRGILDPINNRGMVDMIAEKEKGRKRDSSCLVAEVLEMDFQVKKGDMESGSFSDCSICLDLAKDPVLTYFGHLFCWACFYQVPNIDSTSKECPVCKGEVSASTVIPIYGNGGYEPVCETESGLKIPPRPKARRVENVRKQRVTRHLSRVPVAEALRRIRI